MEPFWSHVPGKPDIPSLQEHGWEMGFSRELGSTQSAEMGGRRCSPLGGFNPPPPVGSAKRARPQSFFLLFFFGFWCQDFIQMGQPQTLSLSLSHRPKDTAAPTPKSGKVCFLTFFFRTFFGPDFWTGFLRKNLPKLSPKSTKNPTF